MPRPNLRDAMPRPPFGSLDTLLLMDLSAESYERLLDWLHPNRDAAADEYQRIRTLLIRRFRKQECADPEALADATMERVAQTLTTKKVEIWEGAKERYFYRVAYYIMLEIRGRPSPEVQMPEDFEVPQPDGGEDLELQSFCLDKCLEKQPSDDRELVVGYYYGTKAIKIQNRAALARKFKLSLPTLRVRARRIRLQLGTCIERCLNDAARDSRYSLPM